MQQVTRNHWLFALLLTVPMILFFIGYCVNHKGLVPSGYIMHDNVSYVAYAKQYTDSYSNLFYSNPFNDKDGYTPIYFQPQTIFFALLLELGIPHNWILIPFTLLCTFLCFRIMISIYDRVAPSMKYRTMGIILFCWGGGLLAFGGILVVAFKDFPGMEWMDSIFILDPGWGWWGLNMGRAMFISVEAFYHLLFLLAILSLLQQKWIRYLLFALLTCIAHPFTGTELIAIVTTWLFAEKVLLRNKQFPWYVLIGSIIIFALHVYYYLYFLQQFPEHRSVSEQYALNWRLRFFNIIPAYCIVGLLATLTLYRIRLTGLLSHLYSRLFLCWFLVAFALANHELFMRPMQPLHFTRGYVWSGLFLLGLYVLPSVLEYVRRKHIALMIIFVGVFLSDNILWLVNELRFVRRVASDTHFMPEQTQILKYIGKKSNSNTLVIGSDLIPYFSTVYSDAYPWISHPFTTPFISEKKSKYQQYILTGEIPAAWKRRHAFFCFLKTDAAEMKRMHEFAFTKKYVIVTDYYVVIETFIPE